MLKNTGKFAGKTVLITGASRGIGKEIGLKLAKDGANIVIAAKTDKPHPKLEGTVFSAADEMLAAGGKVLPCIVDVRKEKAVQDCVNMAVAEFGGIDVLINNASAINLAGTVEQDMKRYDLMHSVNSRGAFLMTKTCVPHMKGRENPHILNLSPPLNLDPEWFAQHVAYTMAKYGMSMQVLGQHKELKRLNIAVNAIWPRTIIWTAAMNLIPGASDMGMNAARKPAIVADAVYAILSRDSKTCTGNFFIDDEVLKAEGVTNFDSYAFDPKAPLFPDFFLGPAPKQGSKPVKSKGSSQKAEKKAEATKPAAAGGPEAFQAIVDAFGAKITDEDVQATKAVFQFVVKPKTGPILEFYFDLKDTGKYFVGRAEAPEITFEATEANLTDILTGKRSAKVSYAMGKIKIKGDTVTALKLEKLLKKFSQK